MDTVLAFDRRGIPLLLLVEVVVSSFAAALVAAGMVVVAGTFNPLALCDLAIVVRSVVLLLVLPNAEGGLAGVVVVGG